LLAISFWGNDVQAKTIPGSLLYSDSGPGGSIPGLSWGGSWDEVPPDSVSPWNLELRGQLNGAQASYRNWEQGGVNTLAINAGTNFNARYRKESFGYNLNIALEYGQAKIDDDYRKTEDEISVRNTFRWFFEDDRWSMVSNFNFLSQFDEGEDNAGEVVVSKFLAPAYITETLGISFQPLEYFSAEFGASARQTIVQDTDLSLRYGLDADENFRNELGFSFLFQFDKEIWENLRYVSSLETFTNANQHVDRSDFSFNNEIIGKVNDILNANLRFTMLYRDDVSDKIQIRQTLSLGLSFRLI
jgi:hypothetical protein